MTIPVEPRRQPQEQPQRIEDQAVPEKQSCCVTCLSLVSCLFIGIGLIFGAESLTTTDPDRLWYPSDQISYRRLAWKKVTNPDNFPFPSEIHSVPGEEACAKEIYDDTSPYLNPYCMEESFVAAANRNEAVITKYLDEHGNELEIPLRFDASNATAPQIIEVDGALQKTNLLFNPNAHKQGPIASKSAIEANPHLSDLSNKAQAAIAKWHPEKQVTIEQFQLPRFGYSDDQQKKYHTDIRSEDSTGVAVIQLPHTEFPVQRGQVWHTKYNSIVRIVREHPTKPFIYHAVGNGDTPYTLTQAMLKQPACPSSSTTGVVAGARTQTFNKDNRNADVELTRHADQLLEPATYYVPPGYATILPVDQLVHTTPASSTEQYGDVIEACQGRFDRRILTVSYTLTD